MKAKAVEVTKIIKVVDTRDYVEIEGTFVPISGTGVMNSCTRCGKEHEVHIHVEYSDKSVGIVGTACVKQAALDKIVTKALYKEEKIKTLKKIQAVLTENRAINHKAQNIVNAMPLPEIIEKKIDERRTAFIMGDTKVWSNHAPGETALTHERRCLLIDSWRKERLNEVIAAQFPTYSPVWGRMYRLSAVEKSLKKLEVE